MQHCSLQHRTLLPSPVTYTTELFLLWLCLFIFSGVISPPFSSSILGTYWPGEFITFCLFIGFSRQEYWGGLPSPSPVDHILSELSTVTCPSWVALHGKAHSCIELDKAMIHVISLVSFLCLWFSFCLPLMDKDTRLVEVSWWEGVAVGESGFCFDGQVMLSKFFI